MRRGSERTTTAAAAGAATISSRSKSKKKSSSGGHHRHKESKDKFYAQDEERPDFDYHTSRDVYQYQQPGREHFPIVKLRPRPSSRKEEEYLTKRKVETKTKKETEKTVKRKILLGDGRVLEDEVPETVRDTVEDTHLLEEEHLENTRDRIVPRVIHWRKNNNIIDDSYNRTINTHDVKENLIKTASTQNLGPVSKRVIEKALKDKRPMREVIEQDQRERSSRRKHREHREHRSHRHNNQQHNSSSNVKHEIVAKPKVIYSSKSHKKIIDTEDVHNISRMLDNGKVLTETFRTQEHEVIDDKEAPDDSSQARTSDGSARVIKDKENFSHNKRDEFTEYYRVPKKVGGGRSQPQLIGRGAHLTTEDKMIEKGAYNWDEMSEKMRQNREKIRQRLHAGEAAERKDALTKKPLNYNQEEKTRKKETDKWLDAHFGSEWSLTSSSMNSGQTTLQNKSSKKHKTAQYDRFGKGVRRSMSFSSIPITYNNGLGGEVQEKTTKTKEKIVKTTTTTYNPAAKGMEKTVFSTITRARTPNPIQTTNNFHISTADNSNSNMNQKHYSRSHHNLSQSMDRNYHTLQREAKRDQSYNNSQSVDRNYHTLRREHVGSSVSPTRREIFKPTSPKQFNSTLNLSPLQAEYVLDEPLRPARNAKAKSLFHSQLLPSELSHHGSQASLSQRSRSQQKTGGSQIRSISAHNINQHNNTSYNHHQRDESVSSKSSVATTSTTNRQREESHHHEERNYLTSNHKENVHGNNVHFQTLEKVHHHVPKTEFAKHIVEERVYSSSTPPPKERRVYPSVEQDKDSTQNRVVYRSESKRGQDDMVRKPLYITELRREKLYPAVSENNLLHDFKKTYSDRGSGSMGGGEKIHMSGTFTERFVTDDDYHYNNNSSNSNNFGHYKTMPRSYLGYRSMERSDAVSVDESAVESKSSGSSGKRKKRRSQSFLVKSTRPQYQYSTYSSPYPRDEGCEEDYVYDRHERKFVNSTGMRHGHSDLRLDKGFQYRLEHEDGGDYGYGHGLGGSHHNVFSKEIVHQQEQLEPQKFKTIIFLNGN